MIILIPFLAWTGKATLSVTIKDGIDKLLQVKTALEQAKKDGANLYGADLRGANLYGANLYGANLRGADLRGADLRGANLYGADLYGADLRGANLYGANLRGADLREAKDADFAAAQSVILPEGDLIGWKKCRNNVVVKLRIPVDAKRSNATGRKCRAEFVEVLEIVGGVTEAVSSYDANVVYRVGEIVRVKDFNEDRWNECSSGIHFFITRVEAEKYTV